jgi:hypothetical protein
MLHERFSPYPSSNFVFYSYTGMIAEEFAQKDARFRKLGYVLSHKQSLEDGYDEFISGRVDSSMRIQTAITVTCSNRF